MADITGTFGELALPLLHKGWRPIPLNAATKVPAEAGWHRFNAEACPEPELRAMCEMHFDAATGLALAADQVALDIDITEPAAAAEVQEIITRVFGPTPLIRIGMAPKAVHIYRAAGSIRSAKPHPVEIYCGSGQVAAFGFHKKAGRHYQWPVSNPLDIQSDSTDIPVITADGMHQFMVAVSPVLTRLRTAARRTGGGGIGIDASEYMRNLMSRGLPFHRAAARTLAGADAGGRHYAVRAVISSGFNTGLDADAIAAVIYRHAPADLLNAVTDDGYLERTLSDFQPKRTQGNFHV